MLNISFLNFSNELILAPIISSFKKGTSVELSVPSANSLLNKFGILNAT